MWLLLQSQERGNSQSENEDIVEMIKATWTVSIPKMLSTNPS